MAVTIQIVKFVKHADGRVEFVFQDGSGRIYATFQDFVDQVPTFNNLGEDEVALRLLFAWLLARNPDLAPASQIIGKQIVLDLTAPAPVKFQ